MPRDNTGDGGSAKAAYPALYDLAMAYYILGKKVAWMELTQDRQGNRTAEYAAALEHLQHAKEYLWQGIRAEIVICAVPCPDAVMEAAWTDLQWRGRLGANYAA